MYVSPNIIICEKNIYILNWILIWVYKYYFLNQEILIAQANIDYIILNVPTIMWLVLIKAKNEFKKTNIKIRRWWEKKILKENDKKKKPNLKGFFFRNKKKTYIFFEEIWTRASK